MNISMIDPVTLQAVAEFPSTRSAADRIGVNTKYIRRALHSGLNIPYEDRLKCCGFFWMDEENCWLTDKEQQDYIDRARHNLYLTNTQHQNA